MPTEFLPAELRFDPPHQGARVVAFNRQRLPNRHGNRLRRALHLGERRWLFGFLWLIAVAYVCGMTVADPDLWGHTLYGLRAIDQGVLAEAVDPFSYTAPGAIWINHEWLTEYIYGWLWKSSGSPGLWMWRNLLALCVFGVGAWAMRRAQVSLAAATLILIFTAQCLSGFFLFVRPQLGTFALFALSLILLRQHWDRPQSRSVWWLPLIVALWVNLHGGFLAGLGLLAIFIGGYVVRACLDRRYMRPMLQLATIGLLSLLATLVNPYGLAMHSMLWEHLVPEQAVREWMPLWAARQAPLYYVPFGLIALALPWSRSWKWIDLLVLAVVGWQALSHIRHVALLAIAVMILLPRPLSESLAALFPQLTRRLARRQNYRARWMGVSALLFLLTALQLPYAVALWKSGLRPWEIAAESSRDVPGVPVRAISVMVNWRIQGNLLTDYGWGQYVLWHLHPASRVAFDGRYRTIYPADLEQEFLAFQHLDAQGPATTPLLDKYDTQIVLLPANRKACRHLDRRSDFVKVYGDAQASLYVRRLPQFQQAILHCGQQLLPGPQVGTWSSFPARPIGLHGTGMVGDSSHSDEPLVIVQQPGDRPSKPDTH